MKRRRKKKLKRAPHCATIHEYEFYYVVVGVIYLFEMEKGILKWYLPLMMSVMTGIFYDAVVLCL